MGAPAVADAPSPAVVAPAEPAAPDGSDEDPEDPTSDAGSNGSPSAPSLLAVTDATMSVSAADVPAKKKRASGARKPKAVAA